MKFSVGVFYKKKIATLKMDEFEFFRLLGLLRGEKWF